MKKTLLSLVLLMLSSHSFSETQYFNGKVERIEICKSNGGNVFVYFKDISGTAPTSTNGCSNDIAFPFVRINSTAGTLSDIEKSILSTVLAAQASERSLRVRYEDQDWYIESIAID